LPRIRHIDSTAASYHLVLVPWAHVFQMCRQWVLHRRWPHRSPIFMAFPVPEQALVAGDFDVLHSASQALQPAQASTI
jgi:hypothetical protein